MNKEFINKIIRLSALNVKQFAEKIGVSPVTARKWQKGNSEPLFINQKVIRYHFKKECQIAAK